jgi:hypothetical protein
LLILSGACAGEAQAPSSALVVSTDPELERMAGEILPGLAARAGIELLEPVRVERRSRAQLEGYLRAKLDEELPPGEAEATVRVYAMLGLLDESLDLRALLLDLYTEQVAGFYEPDSTALFVLNDQPSEALEGLLLHELVHAVQDQAVDLSALTSDDDGADRAAAAHAAVEGHATLVMLEFMLERMSGQTVDLAQVPGLADQMLPAFEGMREQFPALAGAPEIVQRSLLFPYIQGAAFVQGLWVREGRVAPFDVHLPRSTEQVLEGDLSDMPVPVRVAVSGGRALHEDMMGLLELEVLVETHLGADSVPVARGWGGDRYVLVQPDGRADPTLFWAAVWDGPDFRDRFIEAFASVLPRLPAPATLTRIEPGGRPGALLTVGDAQGLAVDVTVGGGV